MPSSSVLSDTSVTTLFIADIHLSAEEPAITRGFLRFLAGPARQAEALYILGDLFDAWIGDDDPNPLHEQIAKAIHQLVDSGVPCFFIHGNRDFLLGERFARRCGMRILPEYTLLELYGHQVLVMHGDTLCTDDAAYQKFRHKVRLRWLQKLFLALPLALRQRIARRLRTNSQAANQQKSMDIMDVNPQAVCEVMSRYQVRYLIHGHTHRQAVHDITVDGADAWRFVLGAWHERGSFVSVAKDGVKEGDYWF